MQDARLALSQGSDTDLSSLLLCQSEGLRLLLLREESDVYKATAEAAYFCEEPVAITSTPFPNSPSLPSLSIATSVKTQTRMQAPRTHLTGTVSHLSLSPSAP